MNCLENVSMPGCVWFESGEKRNILASILSGLLVPVVPLGSYDKPIAVALPVAEINYHFFTGWWFIIDSSSVNGDLPKAAHVCGVFATLSLIMVNSVSNAQVRGETYTGGCMGPRGARLWLFLGFVVGFASLIAACWILFANFVNSTKATEAGEHKTWTGVSLFLQNAFIFAASLVFKFARTEDTWG